ncbi:MAG: alpha/beta hydrolase [Ferruginibacter sp.]
MSTKYLISYPLFIFVTGLTIAFFAGCAFKGVSRYKHIEYLRADTARGIAAEQLNIFAPAKHEQKKEVLIFVYGGNWNSGRKELYSFFGSRMARKDILTVIVDYPKSPKADFNEMANDVAASVKWVKENIAAYGGDPDRIFISGHSAGGHLAALVTIKKDYFERIHLVNPIKGIILIDAAGLDMYGYLNEENFEAGNTYLKTFTSDPAQWKAASPLYFLHPDMPPMLIYRGGRTYPSIEESNEKFIAALKEYVPGPDYHILKGKKHVPMILQFFNTGNPRFREIIGFMKKL